MLRTCLLSKNKYETFNFNYYVMDLIFGCYRFLDVLVKFGFADIMADKTSESIMYTSSKIIF